MHIYALADGQLILETTDTDYIFGRVVAGLIFFKLDLLPEILRDAASDLLSNSQTIQGLLWNYHNQAKPEKHYEGN